jgi:hypothetical protein
MDPRYAGIEFIPPPGRPRVSIAVDDGKTGEAPREVLETPG